MTKQNSAFVSHLSSPVSTSVHLDERIVAEDPAQNLDMSVSIALSEWKSHEQQQGKRIHSINDNRYISVPIDVVEPPSDNFRTQTSAKILKEELQRLEGLKEDFLSTVSHELKTPLASMYLSIQLLELLLLESSDGLDVPELAQTIKPVKSLHKKPFQAEQQAQDMRFRQSWVHKDQDKRAKIRRCLETLSKECRKEITLVNNLLSLQESIAVLPSPAPACIFLYDWLGDVVKPFYAQFKRKQHQFYFDISPTLSYIISDHLRLEKILQELMTNACKFTPEEGHISLSVMEQDHAVMLTVLSKGEAIPVEEIPHLFTMFYRVPKSDPWETGGTGIGLALAKKMAESIGGDIRVSTGNFGNAFTLCVPTAKAMKSVGA